MGKFDNLKIDKPIAQRSGKKSHVVKTMVNGKPKIIRFGEAGAVTNRSAKQRKAFRDRHRKNIAKGKSSAAYWANRVKWKGK